MILHIFKKDVRRLWWAILPSLALTEMLAREDRWRSDLMPGAAEGWLNLLLPVLWAALVALAVEQEPIAGDRQFWITRPYGRGALLAEKGLFAVAFVHAPYLILELYVVGARGFWPVGALPHLLMKQVMLAGAVTLPALALASLFRNFTHFILAVFAIAAASVVISGRQYGFLWLDPSTEVRRLLTVAALASVAITVAAVQYLKRRVWTARGLGLSAALAGAAISGLLPDVTAMQLRAAISPAAAEPALRPRAPSEAPPRGYVSPGSVALPIEISGVPASVGFYVRPLETEIAATDGTRMRSARTSDYRYNRRIDFEVMFARGSGEPPDWLILHFSDSALTRLRNSRVLLRGKAEIQTYTIGTAAAMALGETSVVPGVGRCSTIFQQVRFFETALKIECERATGESPAARVTLAASGREWKGRVGSYGTSVAYPSETWLSPLSRAQGFFTITDRETETGQQNLVPREALNGARILIAPEIATGYGVIEYELRDVVFGEYVVR